MTYRLPFSDFSILALSLFAVFYGLDRRHRHLFSARTRAFGLPPFSLM